METILCAMGLPVIDENLDSILAAMEHFPAEAALGSCLNYARALGLLFALCVGSYECWMMMLGRRGMDVMKLLRIVAMSMCITYSPWICNALKMPGRALEGTTKAIAQNANAEVAAMELEVANKQKVYLDKLDEAMAKAQAAHDAASDSKDEGWWDDVKNTVAGIGDSINFTFKKLAFVLETKMSEFLSAVVKFIGETIFQLSYYGTLLAGRIFMSIMAIFCPIEFALSLAPPFRAAWSQWMSKYLSLSLWGFVTYMILYYVDQIMLYFLNADIMSYTNLINSASGTWEEVGMLGAQGFGTTIMYVVALLIGAFILRMVPEVASWLIPGGVSAGIGQQSGARTYAGAVVATRAAGSVGVAAASTLGNAGARGLGVK